MHKSPKTYVSSAAFGEKDFRDMLRVARSWGVKKIELTAGLRVEDAFSKLHAASGSFDFLVHNYFPPPLEDFVLNLASEDPETLLRSMAHCHAAVDLSAAVGARWFSVHAGFAAVVKPEHLGRQIPFNNRRDKRYAKQIFENSVRDLVAYAESKNVGILIENNVVASPNLVDGRNEMLLLATGDELVDFARRMAHQHLGLLIDFGHVNVTAATLGLDRDAFLDEIAPYTRALHLSDNDGLKDSNRPFGRDSWIGTKLARFDPDYIVVEANRLTQSELAACIDTIEVAYE